MEKTDLKFQGEGCVWGWGLGGVGDCRETSGGFSENQNHRVVQYNTIKSGFVKRKNVFTIDLRGNYYPATIVFILE